MNRREEHIVNGTREHAPRYIALCIVFLLALFFAATAKAQVPPQLPDQGPAQTNGETAPKTAGNYSIQQSIEFGYRDSMISGNINNYNTYENLGSGWRLFDYDLDMHSVNHQGVLFDNLSFQNFGYGGDPNSMTRLRIDKNKWYDFRAMFRRDEYFFDYDLLANPLNPAVFPTGCTIACTPQAITNSPHALYYDRHMQDYDLTLLPESRLRFRVGYSRVLTGGNGTDTYEPTYGLLDTDVANATNTYRIGVDYRGLPRTTLSYDEVWTYTNIQNNATAGGLNFQLANGTPVDLGEVFNGTTPCAAPITNNTTTPPTITSNCNGILTFGLISNPHSSFPVERFTFQSDYFKNFHMSGAASYSDGTNSLSDLNEVFNGWISRTATRESTTAGPAAAKRVLADANWSGEYEITKTLSLSDEIFYDNWRIPSSWETVETNLFATAPGPGQSGLSLPISNVTPANFATACPTAPYNQAGCPQHTSSSGADYTGELAQEFLAQRVINNLVELKWDIASRISAHLGYLYDARTIADFSATFDAGEIYLPGGTTGTAGNDYLAARGDCALVSGALPASCVVNANGSVQEGSATNLVPEAGNDTARNIFSIHESAVVFGVNARPTDKLRIDADIMAGYNDNSFTRISPRQLQSYKVHASYKPKVWASLDGSVDIHENRDDVFTVNDREHGRAYSFSSTLSPYSYFWVDFGYNYMDIYMQSEICFADSGAFEPAGLGVCPVATSPVAQGTLGIYASQDHYAYADVMWKPYKRVTATVGYLGSIVRGNTTVLNVLNPTGTLDFNYLKPYAALTIDLYKGLAYKTAWNYYGYNDHGVTEPTGLAAIPLQNFNGSNVTFSLRYAF
jgi:hypothetical protein